MKQLTAVFLFISACSFFGHSQTDFNNYTTLQSSGALPEDFTGETFEKIEEGLEEDREGMSQLERRRFLEGTNYAIDELLHSGFVTYGDELSNYVTEIAKKLLKGKSALRKELRFYTLKSNATNAFSTDQGIIFVTTGLISQLSSEAQLAYILAHEICHYTEKHVVESFNWSNKKGPKRDWVKKMSVYSRDRELEADQLAVELYHKAGYAKEELIPTFDVLKYSYLPFDEIEVPQSYFSSEKMYIPPSQFPTKEYEIKAIEDEDDSESSHPNIKTRKESTAKEIEKFSNWDNVIFHLGKETFEEMRNIARFECVRADILDAKYGDAIYSIFLLERDFPQSLFLDRAKAHCWLGLYQYEKAKRISTTIDKTSEYEGNSALVHFLIRKFNEKSMASMSLRQVHDLHVKNENDAEIEAIYQRLIKELAWNKRFELSDYSTMDFHTAATKFAEKQAATAIDIQDSSKVETNKTSSKYDRIKKTKNVDEPDNFDTTRYYVYGIADILEDQNFKNLYNSDKSNYEDHQQKLDALDELSPSEKRKRYKEKRYTDLHIGVEELICVEPKVYSYNSRSIDFVRSEKLEKRFSETLASSAKDAGLTVYPVDSRSIVTNGSQGFNERSTLISLLHQMTNEDDIQTFPIDYQLLLNLGENYGDAKVMFSLVEHTYSPSIAWGYLLYSLILPPVLPIFASIHIPIELLKGNHTTLNIIVLDPQKGGVLTGDSHYFNEPMGKHHLGAHLYDILYNLKTAQ